MLKTIGLAAAIVIAVGAYSNFSKMGNCMSEYVKNLENGTSKSGFVYEILEKDSGKKYLHVDSAHLSDTSELDVKMIGLSEGCWFKVPERPLISTVNTAYCFVQKSIFSK